jgi:thiol-disulfide isomerase/thioredoxin
LRLVVRNSASVFLVLILISAVVCPPAFAESIHWTYSYEDSLKLASREEKPIMVGFYTTWCMYCRKLDEVTYVDSAVVEGSKNFICLKVDGEKRRDVAYGYGIGKFPTILFLDPAGRVIWREFGYRDPIFLARRMQEVLTVFKASKVADPYIRQGIKYLENNDPGSAIKDFSTAILINPNNLVSYFYRSIAYMFLKQYDKSWDDVHFIERRGNKVDPRFMAELQRLSGRER